MRKFFDARARAALGEAFADFLEEAMRDIVDQNTGGVKKNSGQRKPLSYNSDMPATMKKKPGRPKTKHRHIGMRLTKKAWSFMERRRRATGKRYTDIVEEALAALEAEEEERR